MRVLIVFILCLMPTHSKAQDFVTQTAREQIDVTVGFVGSSIEVFGSRSDQSKHIAVVIEGPEVEATVWKKSRILGAWVNANSAVFKNIPSYYQFATSLDLNKEEEKEIIHSNGIGNDALIERLSINKPKKLKFQQFKQALLDRKVMEEVFFREPAHVNFLNENFFRTRFEIPASAPTGKYKIHSYLFENNKIIQHDINEFKVEQVGLNAFIFDVAQKQSTLYAIICIFLAVFSGWLVSVLKVRP